MSVNIGELLVPVCGNSKEDAFLEKVDGVAKTLNASVCVFYAEPDPKDMLLLSADGLTPAMGASLVESLEKTSQETWDNIVAKTKKYPDFSVEQAKGAWEELLPLRGSISDFMVINSLPAEGKGAIAAGFEEALMGARIPCIILKDNCEFNLDHVAIAWDGSMPSAYAMRCALSILKEAKKVSIIQIEKDNNFEDEAINPPHKILEYLQKIGVNAEVFVKKVENISIGQALIAACNEIGANLMVSGAYGHSRAREFVFGGTSKTLLKSPNGPNLIIAH